MPGTASSTTKRNMPTTAPMLPSTSHERARGSSAGDGSRSASQPRRLANAAGSASTGHSAAPAPSSSSSSGQKRAQKEPRERAGTGGSIICATQYTLDARDAGADATRRRALNGRSSAQHE